MNTAGNVPRARRVWCDDNNLWVELTDDKQISVSLACFPALLNATPSQRKRFEMSGGGTGLHWEELDEDISVPDLVAGVTRKTAPAPDS